jgi:predicted DNA-binding transcriptional regulator AlpA
MSIARLLREREAAGWLDLSPATLRRWRSESSGPRFVRLGRAVRYDLTDLVAFVEAGRTPPDATHPRGTTRRGRVRRPPG